MTAPPVQTTPGTPRRGYLPTLDGWRAIAILGVMVAHGTDAVFGPAGSLAQPFLHEVTRYGAKGVDVFFGISGFLICSRLIEEHEARGRISLKGFYIRRFFRILPPYLFFLAVLAALGAGGAIAVSVRELAASLFFVRNYLPVDAGAGWYTGHLWSLAVEEHFYLLWPTLLVMWGIRRARWGVVGLSLGIAAWRVFEFRARVVEQTLPGLGFYDRTDVRLDALLWGCWLALVITDPAVRETVRKWMSPPVWVAALVAFLACLWWQPPLAMLWQSVLIPIVIVGTVLRPQGLVGRGLEHPAMRWIGRLSYSLYLWQQVFLVGREVERPLPFGPLQNPPVNVLAVFAMAAVSYYLIERPTIKLGHRVAAPVTPGRT